MAGAFNAGLMTLSLLLICLVELSHSLKTSSSSHGLGDFVAQGLGLTRDAVVDTPSSPISTRMRTTSNVSDATTTALQIASPSFTTSTASSFASNSESNDSVHDENDSSAGQSSTTFPAPNTTATIEVHWPSGDLSALPSWAVTGSTVVSWPSAQNVDECWAQWDRYWTQTHNATFADETYIPTKTYTTAYVNTFSYPASEGTTYTSTWAYTWTKASDNGGFILSATTVISSYTTIVVHSERLKPTVEVVTDSRPAIMTDGTIIRSDVWTAPNMTAPPCSLPTPYPQCQQQWRDWVSGVGPAANTYLSRPACAAVSLTAEPCMSLKDEYVRGNQNILGWMGKHYTKYSNGWHETTYSGNSSSAWVWPTSLELAPGCTMGCGRCAVTGSTIDFLFWPPGPTTDGPPVTAVTLGTTLTSPTNYISFSRVWAQDACGNIVGHNITSTIVPVPATATLSSVWGMPGGFHDAMGYSVVSLFTASLNINDLLHTPVPYSIYMSQPWCATSRYWQNVHANYPEVNVSTYSCPMNESYKPIIVAPGDVLANIDPAFASCSPEVKGFYDPPSALARAASAVAPTTPNMPSPTQTTPAQTAQAETTQLPKETSRGPDYTTAQQTSAATARSHDTAQTTQIAAAEDDPADTAATSGAGQSTIGPHSDALNGHTAKSQHIGDVIASLLGLVADSVSTQGGHQNQGSAATPDVGGALVSLLDGQENPVSAQEGAQRPATTTAHIDGAIVSLLSSQTQHSQAQAEGHDQGLRGPAQTAHAQDAASARQSNAAGDSIRVGPFNPENHGGTSGAADSPIPSRTAAPAMATFNLQGDTYTAQRGSGLVMDGTTLSDGAAAITTAGRTIELTPSGVMVDGQLAAYRGPQHVDGHAPDAGSADVWSTGSEAAAVVTIGGQRVTATQGKPLVVGETHTLLLGGPAATVGGRVVSMAEGGVVVDRTRTVTFSSTRGGEFGVARSE